MREEVYRSISRLVSVIVVLNLALGGFLGLMLIEESANVEAAVNLPPIVGDTITITDTRNIFGSDLDDGTLDADWNLVINAGGRLNLFDCALIFQSDTSHRYSITVNGGQLWLDNATITVKTDDLFDNYETIRWFNYSSASGASNTEFEFTRLIPFDITVTGGGIFNMAHNSALMYEGELSVTSSRLIVKDSIITSPNAPYSTHDWGVVVSIDSCTSPNNATFADVRIEKSPWYQGISWYDPDTAGPAIMHYKNHSISNSEVNFMNTYIDLDYRTKSSPHLWSSTNNNHMPKNVNPNHNAIEITGNSKVKFFGLTIDMSETGDIIPPGGSTAIEVDATADVTLYRWLTVFPVDNKNIPVGSGATVDISTIYTGDATINGYNNINDHPDVTQYIHDNTDCTLSMVGSTIHAVTGTSGKAVFGLLSDILTDTGWPNSDQRDGYNIDASYNLPPLYTSVGLVDFENFPQVTQEDNYVDFYMDPFGFAAPHPELYPEFDVQPPSTQLNNVVIDFDIKVFNDIVGVGVNANDILVQIWDGNPSLNSSSKIDETTIASLIAGTNTTVSFSWTATPPGAHTIWIGVDRAFDDPFLDNVIPEENEMNNVITTTITVLERPDLFINGSLISFSPGNVVVNGTAVTIKAQVQNLGGSTASNVKVRFYEGTAVGSGAYIGQDIITVQAGSSVIAQMGWSPNTGFQYVWVKVDEIPLPNGEITEKDETNNVGVQSIDVRSRPDLVPNVQFNPNSPQYEGTVIAIQANVVNSGGSNVTKPVTVVFYEDDLENEIGRVTIPVNFEGVSIGRDGASVTVSVQWTAEYPPAGHTFLVVVDPGNNIDESNEGNNMASAVFTVDPRPNLVISSSDITFDDAYPMEGQNVQITMEIWNNGLSDVVDPFWVRIWLDEVGTGTLLTGFEETATITSGNSITRNYNWNNVGPYGKHDIWVTLDYSNQVAETDDADNMAFATLVIFKVPSDLIVNDLTNYPPFPIGTLTLEDYWETNDPYVRDGYTLVEQGGELTIRNSIFKIVGATEDYEFNIVVKDSGKLYIEGDSLITSEQYLVNIYVMDTAELHIEGSTLASPINIIAMDSAKIYIEDNSKISGDLISNQAGNLVEIWIINSTLDKILDDIGGGTKLEIWGSNIAGQPASDTVITLADSATANIDWFLKILAVDVNNKAIEGVDVDWYRSPPWTESGSGKTDSDGFALFRLRGMEMTATTVVEDVGSYKVKGDFTYMTTTYYPDSNVSFDLNRNKQKTIKFSSVMPDLDPPLWVTYPFSVLSVGDTATIVSYVNNTGSNTAYNVYVKFDDDTSESGWPKIVMNESIPAGGSWRIEVEWVPQLVGWHNISIMVDPNNLIIEGDEDNNYNEIPVFVTPQKADLVVNQGDITFLFPSTGPTENDTITIQARIHNLGETNAYPIPELEVKFSLGTAGGPTSFLGWGNISGVTAGSSTVSSFEWTTTSPPGTFWIWIDVDTNTLVEETDDNNNRAGNSIVIKTYADISPVGLEFLVNDNSVTTTTDTSKVTLRTTVQNTGQTVAKNVKVQFFDGDPSAGGVQIGSTQTIATIPALIGSGEAQVVWTATVSGLSENHNLYVKVSGVDENNVGNNVFSRIITVTLRPILTVVDIEFSDNSPFEGESFTIFAFVKNTGGTAAPTFNIAFWAGDPNGGGTQIGSDSISLGIDQTKEVNVTWIPLTGGASEIFVVADSDNSINEADETNNVASEVIVVYSSSDIIVNNANTPLDIGSVGSPEPLAPQHRGYVLVEEDGVLTMTFTNFQILQSTDYQFNIIVRNNGTLIIEEGSTLFTNGPLMRLYLYDNSTLIVRDSTISSTVIDIMAFGNSKIIIDESVVSSFIKANAPTADVSLDVTNSSLTQSFSFFGGTSDAVFINVTTPAVELSGSATLTIFQWLFAYVRDGAGTGISGSDVTVSNLFPPFDEIPESPKVTGEEGLALFPVKTDFISPSMERSDLSYSVVADYVYETVPYSGNTQVTFTSYLDDKVKNFVTGTIIISQLKPNLLANSSSVKFFKDGIQRQSVGVGERITVEGTVWNIGNASTTPQTQVRVRFHFEVTQTNFVLIGEDIIDTEMEAKIGSGKASVMWIPTEAQAGLTKNVHITVDPLNKVPELKEGDNTGFSTVDVIRPPDLQVSDITFSTDDASNIESTIEGKPLTISATIQNIGTDRSAFSINVSFYSGFADQDGDMLPDPDPDLLGTQVFRIGDRYVIPSLTQGQSIRVTSDVWDTTGHKGGHSIYVYVTDGAINLEDIVDQNLENNNASRNFVVFPQPDLEPKALPPQTNVVSMTGAGGTLITGNPQIGQSVTLHTTVFNNGQVNIPGVIVQFWLGDPEGSGTQIGSNQTISLLPNSPNNASVPWTVVAVPSTGGAGDLQIYVWVNPDASILESNYGNNKKPTTFSVEFSEVEWSIITFPKSSYSAGELITVSAKFRFSETFEGIPNQAYTVRVRDAETTATIREYTGVITPQGIVLRDDIAAPEERGKYYVEFETTYGGVPVAIPTTQFTVEVEDEPLLPLWMILLIVLIAVVMVIVVGFALAKLGVGKLVECGECGSFIHEGEKKCPKCGAVFETDTAKCSECGSWIPVDSKSCPECGAVFKGLEKDKKDYIEKMKVQYAAYVEQYRGEAREDLGSQMTDEEFNEWWKASPKYVGFEDWLDREEELKKGRTKNCPSCNTINPESAAICFKCGTVFQKEEELPPPDVQRPPARPPAEIPAKQVARPPVDAPPAVVPKKVVKPPEVVPKKVVKKPPTVVPKKVVKRPPEEQQ